MEHQCHKKKYNSHEEAERALFAICRNHKNGQHPVRVYKCPCGYWHLTSHYEHHDGASDLRLIIRELYHQIQKLETEIALLKSSTNKELKFALAKDEHVASLRKQLSQRDKIIA